MKSIYVFTLLTSAAALAAASGAAYSHEHVSAPLPQESDLTCNEAVDQAAADLAEKGFFVPWNEPNVGQIEPEIAASDDNIQKFYYNYPPNRTQTITFGLSGDSTALYQGLMNSPQYMSTMAAKIMVECPQVGLVEFSHWWEGVVPVGYFSDNTARPFTWVDDVGFGSSEYTRQNGSTIQYEWGYFFSP